MPIHIIDLSYAPQNTQAATLSDWFTDMLRRDGVLGLINHGIDYDLLAQKQLYDEQLFSLPDLVQYKLNLDQIGKMGGYYCEPDKYDDTRHMWHVLQDPAHNYTPEKLLDFIPLSIKLLHQYKRLLYRLLGLIEESLRLTEKTLRNLADDAIPMLNSFECYQKADIPNPPQFRVDEHTDRGLLTIMPIPHEPGYEAYIGECWTPVLAEEFPPHTLLIHGGRTLQRTTGIKPCNHRVVWAAGKRRVNSLFGVRFTTAEE